MDELRAACAAVAAVARQVRVQEAAIPAYAAALAPPDVVRSAVAQQRPDDTPPPLDREGRAAFWLTLDAINFGSGWFPTLRKRGGLSGYGTIAAAWGERFAAHGAWPAAALAGIDARTLASVLGQDPAHELMALYAISLRDLGARVAAEHDGRFGSLAGSGGGSAVALARRLGEWPCFADVSRYGQRTVPFRKRAQIAAADLARAGVSRFDDLGQLTMFADNLVPHVLRLDGVLRFEPELVARIDRETLLAHGSPEEVEIRACAVHAVELIVAARGGDLTAAGVDELLWNRGQQPPYKASPRHRSRCTAY
ncbi:MAG: queuosine salvage family protein [Solirubrobacteraceae bacterium]